MPLLHTCLLPSEDEEDVQETRDVRWLIQTVQDLTQCGEWDRGPEHDS